MIQESPGSNGSDPRESGHNSSSQMVYSNSKNPAPPKQYPLFDGYEVIRELGKGTHATCYLTKDPTMQLWAIKVRIVWKDCFYEAMFLLVV